MHVFKARVQRWIHKWLAIFITLQLLLWSITGLYFSSFDIHDIHGEYLLKSPTALALQQPLLIDFDDLLRRYPTASKVKLSLLLGEPHFQFQLQNAEQQTQWHLLNAKTGQLRAALTENEVAAIAMETTAGDASISDIQWLTEEPPSELAARHLPVWRVNFSGIEQSSLYIHPVTGQVVTKRHNRWRIFDLFWRIHILDIDGENVANPLLTVLASMALLTALSGLILLMHLLRTLWRKRTRL